MFAYYTILILRNIIMACLPDPWSRNGAIMYGRIFRFFHEDFITSQFIKAHLASSIFGASKMSWLTCEFIDVCFWERTIFFLLYLHRRAFPGDGSQELGYCAILKIIILRRYELWIRLTLEVIFHLKVGYA